MNEIPCKPKGVSQDTTRKEPTVSKVFTNDEFKSAEVLFALKDNKYFDNESVNSYTDHGSNKNESNEKRNVINQNNIIYIDGTLKSGTINIYSPCICNGEYIYLQYITKNLLRK